MPVEPCPALDPSARAVSTGCAIDSMRETERGGRLEVLVSSSSESVSGSGCQAAVLFFTEWVSVRCSAT